MEGSTWFYNAPVHPDALVWSEDDLLAVATGSVVTIVSPFDISGGRGYVDFTKDRDLSGWAAGCVPEDPEPCLKMALCCLNELRFRDTSWAPHVLSVDWSPSGCGADGGCLLAASLSDYHVFVCSPALGKSCAEWKRVIDLGTQLKEHMKKTRWNEKGKAWAVSSVKDEEMLRLRGGGGMESDGADGSIPQTSVNWNVSPNDDVEVMNTGILKGLWFVGVVLKVMHGYALVEYAMLYSDCTGKNKLREWFPIPGNDLNSREKLQTGEVIHDSDSNIRPAPPENLVAMTAAECKPGGTIETMDDAYWMSAEILSVDEPGAMLQIKLANSAVVQRVQCGSVRKIAKWSSVGWVLDGEEGGKGIGDGKAEAAPRPKRKRAASRTSTKRKTRSSTKQSQTRQKEAEPVTPSYKVPDDFDASKLGPELQDASSPARLRLDLAKAGLARWMTLRSALPDDKVEIYKLGEAMKGEDVKLFEQTAAELIHVYGKRMAKVKLLETELRKELRVHIRRKAICSHNAVYRPGRNDPVLPKSLLPMIGQEPSNPLAVAVTRKRTRSAPTPYDAFIVASDDQPLVPGMTPKKRPWPRKRTNRDITMSTIGCLVVQDTYDSWKKVKPNKKRKGVHQLHVGQGPTAPNEVYEFRLSLIAAKCVAWSPSIQCSDRKSSVIAVGTESGHVVFWRCNFDGLCGDLDGLKEGLTLLGSIEVQSGEISTLKWHLMKVDESTEFLVLVSGGVRGDVRLTGFRPSELANVLNESNDSLEYVLETWGWVCPPDMQPVGCVTVGVDQQSDGESLVIGIGKSGGEVAVWHSALVGELAAYDGDAWVIRGELIRIPRAHNAFGVTGLSCGLVGGLVASAGMDGSVKCWKRVGSSYAEVEGPQQLSEETTPDPTHMPFGVAKSQNGLLLAILRDQGRKLWDAQVQKMTWKRLAHASVEMFRIHGNLAALSHKEALAGVGAKEPHKIVSMSDVAVTILSGHTDSDENKCGDGVSGSESNHDGNSDERVHANVKGRSISLAKTVLARLEQDFNILEFKSIQDIPDDTWLRLRLAVSLRYMLRKELEPAPHSPAPGGIEAKDLLRMEFYLLQHHVYSVIENRMPLGDLPVDGDPWKHVAGTMCRWVQQHCGHPDMHPQLVKAAENIASDVSHALEIDLFSDGCMASGSGHPVASARVAASSAIDFDLQRCGASLLACCSIPSKWGCLVCKRKYILSPCQMGYTGSHECLYCGVVLTSIKGEMALAAAGAYHGKHEKPLNA